MCVLLITRLLRLVGRWARKPVNHTSWVALVTPTDRPKSVRNRCLIELFCGVVCVVTCPFDISVGEGDFVIGLGQISSFLSIDAIPYNDNLVPNLSENFLFFHLVRARQKSSSGVKCDSNEKISCSNETLSRSNEKPSR